jgi:hypothetical protein
MNMHKSKNTIMYLVIALCLVLIILYIWNKRTENKEEITMPHQDIYWKHISGEIEHRDKTHNTDITNDTNNTNLSYTKVPMENDTRFITGMNKYLWDKQKQCTTC